ncbi:MAG: TatD family hydrolase [Pseudomonadota bacterium]|nr:TatD family hydrolase [Pseudomonadota bacterium]
MYVDSHCHLDFPELSDDLSGVLQRMSEARVTHALVISVNLESWTQVHNLALRQAHLYATVGVHPDYQSVADPEVGALVDLARKPKVVGIGETGLDYYRLTGDLEWQRLRFRRHIRAAREAGKPLVIHTRSSAEDTIAIMREENAAEVGGVMHCFTETWEVAAAALEMGFHISISGIVTFKNAAIVKDVARKVPLDRLLIETDSPYLAPVPHRGKLNEPSYVPHVAHEIARLREVSVDDIAAATSANFFRLFSIPRMTPAHVQ